MDKPILRSLAAFSFLVLSVFGMATWINPFSPFPWWLPFLMAVILPSILGICLFIIMGKGMFDNG